MQVKRNILGTAADAEATGVFKRYPCLSSLAVPAGTDRGVDHATPSFQDSALWVANADVPDDVVYDLLSRIYTDAGLAYMRQQKEAFKDMSVDRGLKGDRDPVASGRRKVLAGAGPAPVTEARCTPVTAALPKARSTGYDTTARRATDSLESRLRDPRLPASGYRDRNLIRSRHRLAHGRTCRLLRPAARSHTGEVRPKSLAKGRQWTRWEAGMRVSATARLLAS